jgi:Chaperone of endosialidase
MGYSLPSGVVNTDSVYFYADTTLAFGPHVKQLNEQVLVVLDYSKLTPALTLIDFAFSVDVSSNPKLVVSYPTINPTGKVLSFLISGGITGQQYNITITANPGPTARYDILTINIPSAADCCDAINPVPELYTQLTPGTDVYINTGTRFFWGAAPPSNPNVLDQWFDTVNSILYERVTDGTTFFWDVLTAPNLVTDAPSTNIIYSRYNGFWVPDPIQADAPSNGQAYVRLNNSWVPASSQNDAPSDGLIYMRSNGAWVSGGEVAQPILLPADPTLPLQAVTKQYVDSLSTVTVSDIMPSSPRVGDLWWDTVSAQLFVWYDDGSSTQWVIANNPGQVGTAGGGVSEAPIDGTMYARIDGIWENITIADVLLLQAALDALLPLAGGTMTGTIDLGGFVPINAPLPVDPGDLANKDYVDTLVGGQGPFLELAGGTMAGVIDLGGFTPTNSGPVVNLDDLTTKDYVDTLVASRAVFQGVYTVTTNTPNLTVTAGNSAGYWWEAKTVDPNIPEATIIALPGVPLGTLLNNGDNLIWNEVLGIYQVLKGSGLTKIQADTLYVQLAGSTMTGALVLSADPVLPLGAATMQYVGQEIFNLAVLRNGDTMVGALFLAFDPTAPDEAATKRYVDNQVGTAPFVPLAGGTMTGPLILSADPTVLLGAATKQYVDNEIAAIPPAQSLPPGGAAGEVLAKIDATDYNVQWTSSGITSIDDPTLFRVRGALNSATPINDANNITLPGMYRILANVANMPPPQGSGGGGQWVLNHYLGSPITITSVWQEAFEEYPIGVNSSYALQTKWVRSQSAQSGVHWNPWVRVAHLDSDYAKPADITAAVSSRVARAGDTMTGPLSINNTTTQSALSVLNTTPGLGAAQFFDSTNDTAVTITNTGGGIALQVIDDTPTAAMQITNNGAGNALQISGGAVLLAQDPTAPLHAATKQYVDANAGSATDPTKVLKTGDTMSGTLDMEMNSNTTGLRLRKTNRNNDSVPRITFENSKAGAGGSNAIMGKIECIQTSQWYAYQDYARVEFWCGSGIMRRTFYGEANNMYCPGTVTAQAWVTTSDSSIKDEIAPIDPANAVPAFDMLAPVRYKWKSEEVENPLSVTGKSPAPKTDPDRQHWGFLADDIQAIAPDAVYEKDGLLGYDLVAVVAITVTQLQETKRELAELRAVVEALTGGTRH